MSTTAFVCAATGTQGNALANQLRALGWAVHVTARNMDTLVVKELQDLGVQVTPGDWEDEAALTTAIAGCSHLFLNLVPSLATMSSEAPHAHRIIAIAKAAGVKHIVYSSGSAIDNFDTLPYYDPANMVAIALGWKREVENAVRAAGFSTWTILRGSWFMPNFLLPRVAKMYPSMIKEHTWTMAMKPDTPIPMVDPDDIARFAAAAFQDPARFDGQEIPISVEFLTPVEIMEQLSEANGKPMKYIALTEEEIAAQKAANPMIAVQQMMQFVHKDIDLEKIKAWGVPMTNFKQYLKREKKAVKEAYQ